MFLNTKLNLLQLPSNCSKAVGYIYYKECTGTSPPLNNAHNWEGLMMHLIVEEGQDPSKVNISLFTSVTVTQVKNILIEY